MLEILGTIGFDWRVAIANLVSFLIIFFILKKYVFGPMRDAIDQRRAVIQEGINKSERSQDELKNAQIAAERIIQDARTEAQTFMINAKDQGDQVIRQAQDKARSEATTIIARAQDQTVADRIRMEKELMQQTAGLVALGVQKILDEEVDEERSTDISKRALSTLSDN
jgi:F-type H+-transporting ATPase subunit b